MKTKWNQYNWSITNTFAHNPFISPHMDIGAKAKEIFSRNISVLPLWLLVAIVNTQDHTRLKWTAIKTCQESWNVPTRQLAYILDHGLMICWRHFSPCFHLIIYIFSNHVHKLIKHCWMGTKFILKLKAYICIFMSRIKRG